MNLWIDHTSLHSSLLCIKGKAREEIDVTDFLQLSLKLIFAEHLYVSGYVSDQMIQKTKDLIDLYIDHGLDSSTITIINFNEKDFSDICYRAATKAIDEFIFSPPCFSEIIKGNPDSLHPILSLKEKHGFVLLEKILSKDIPLHEVEEIAHYDLREKAWGQLIYTIYSQPKLLNFLYENYSSSYWNKKNLYGLASIIRCYQNEQIAEEARTLYAPSESRSFQQRRAVEIIFKQLNCILTEAAQDLIPKKLVIPSVLETISSLSQGDQQGVINETIVLRDLAKKLRDLITNRLSKIDITTVEGIHRLNSEILELSIVLNQKLNPRKKNPRLRKAIFNFQQVFNVPIPNINSLADWIEYKQRCGHIIVLTKLSESIAYEDNVKRDYEKLLKTCLSER